MTLPTRARRVLRSIRQSIPSGVVLGRRSAGDGPAEFIPLDEITSAQLDAISSTRGSVLYRGASQWEALAPGTVGDVLTTQGAGNDPIWSAAAGGGQPWYFDPPTTSELPTAVSAGTPTGTSVADDTDVGFLMGGSLSVADHLFGSVQAAPAVPFTTTARVSLATGTGTGGIGGPVAGILLRASGTGLRQVIGVINFNQFGHRRATNTTFGAAAGVDVGLDPRHGVWIQVETTVTQHLIRISDSGKVWIPWLTLSGANYVTGLDQVGLGVTGVNNFAATLTCDVWDVA